MTNCSNPLALGWKHPGVEGIETRQGVITKWPLGPMPDQATVDGWVVEYEGRDVGAEDFDVLMASDEPLRRAFKKLVLAINDGTFEPGANISNAALKALLKPE